MTSKKNLGAMFDVRPARSEGVDVEEKTIDLAVKPEKEIEIESPSQDNELAQLRDDIVEEHGIDTSIDTDEITQLVARLGGKIHEPEARESFRRPSIKKTPMRFPDVDIQAVDYTLPEPEEEKEEGNQGVPPEGSNEVDVWLNKMKEMPPEIPVSPTPPPELSPKLVSFKKYQSAILIVFIAVVGFYAANIFKVKNSGEAALANLEFARTNLENFEFQKAATNFSIARDKFDIVSGRLNLMGLDFAAAFKGIPGLDKANSAKNLIEAGEELARAGESLSVAMGRLTEENLFSYFGLSGEDKKSLSIFVDSFRKPILEAQLYVENAVDSLSEVDDSIIPEDKRELFNELKDKLPLFESFIADAVEYSSFLSSVVGEGSSRTYLVLFQNTSEARATGGFPGSYALVTLKKGYFEGIDVDDVYNPDGQIKENIIPPRPLQHITPTWGMRDANWFANFPTSAFKIIEFYKKGSDVEEVHGVFSVTPEVIIDILRIVGDIEVPEYNVVLNADNFMAEIQNEVEYGGDDDREHSKVILTDFTPLLLERLSALPQEKWIEVSEILMKGIGQKQIMAYFTDPVLQSIAVKNDFAGEVKKVDGDYLSIIHSNVKGSKTDKYTDTTVSVETSIMGSNPRHKVTITRKHNGGNTEYGFYNRTNPDYVRVLVPKGSKLLSIEGTDKVDYKPLVSYNNKDFVADPDLEAYENTRIIGDNNVELLEESGKGEFAFWMVVAPGQEQTVTLEYVSPIEVSGDYTMYIQKQSGTIGHGINYSFQVPSNLNLIYKSPYLEIEKGNVVMNSNLDEDKLIEIRLR